MAISTRGFQKQDDFEVIAAGHIAVLLILTKYIMNRESFAPPTQLEPLLIPIVDILWWNVEQVNTVLELLKVVGSSGWVECLGPLGIEAVAFC